MHFTLITAAVIAHLVATAISTRHVRPVQQGLVAATTGFCGRQNGGKSCSAMLDSGGPCCSQYGFCGIGPRYCGIGCQPAHGKCDPPVENKDRCGPNYGNHTCSDNEYCSHQGYCGVGSAYCSVPNNCQAQFGRCDSDLTPTGPSTQDDVRHKPGKAPYDAAIGKCKVPHTVALTFDDGPSANTMALLDILNKHNAKGTFFVSGVNNGKGPIDAVNQWTDAIISMAKNGHQVASHGWSHLDLDALSANERRHEMLKNERALANILGKYPTYMRPPYSRCTWDTGCVTQMFGLGYRVIGYSVDSTDWQHPADLKAMTEAINQAFDEAPANGSMLLIQHDTIAASALLLTQHILHKVHQKGWKAVTVAECLGEPLADAYHYPENFTLASGGCAMVDRDLCLKIKSFETKKECFQSLQDCLRQLWPKNVQDGHAKEVCDMLTLFCAQCDMPDSDRKCITEDFHYTRPGKAVA